MKWKNWISNKLQMMSAGALAYIKNMAKDYIIEGSEITLTNKKIKDIKSN